MHESRTSTKNALRERVADVVLRVRAGAGRLRRQVQPDDHDVSLGREWHAIAATGRRQLRDRRVRRAALCVGLIALLGATAALIRRTTTEQPAPTYPTTFEGETSPDALLDPPMSTRYVDERLHPAERW